MFSCSVNKIFAISALFFTSVLFSADIPELSKRVSQILPAVVKVKIQRGDSSDDENGEPASFDGGGSGIVFDNDHHIITNYHVVKDAKKIIIIDYKNTEYPAFLVGSDEKTDIAVLHVPAYDAIPPVFADSDNVLVGESTFAIGSPFSLGHSVSAGIISQKERFLSNYPFTPFIQTDAAINPGNSGGALFNLNGELIAMVSTYYAKQGNYTNIGFAIPSNVLQRIANTLVHDSKIERGYLGADLVYSDKLTRKMGYPGAVLITRCEPGSPCDAIGLKTGDLIVGINDISYKTIGGLFWLLERSRPGDKLLLSVVRNKIPAQYPLILVSDPDLKTNYSNAGKGDLCEKVGLILSEEDNIVKVLLSFGNAKNIGIDPQDIITHINGSTVTTISELNSQLAAIKDNETILINISRNGENIILPFGNKNSFKINTFKN